MQYFFYVLTEVIIGLYPHIVTHFKRSPTEAMRIKQRITKKFMSKRSSTEAMRIKQRITKKIYVYKIKNDNRTGKG